MNVQYKEHIVASGGKNIRHTTILYQYYFYYTVNQTIAILKTPKNPRNNTALIGDNCLKLNHSTQFYFHENMLYISILKKVKSLLFLSLCSNLKICIFTVFAMQ